MSGRNGKPLRGYAGRVSLPGEIASRTVVLIPALNEEEALPTVLHQLREAGLSRILVVNNGSTDRTAGVAQAAGAEVITENKRGYGQACWKGLQHIGESADWILFCDADGSDDLSVLPGLFDCARQGDEFVLANRRATREGRSHLTPVQRFGNALSGFLISLIWGRSYDDLGPLRLIKRGALERIGMRDRGFGWTVEMQARAAELAIPTREIPASYRRRIAGRSKISGTLRGSFHAGTIILATLGWLALRSAFSRSARGGMVACGLLMVGSALAVPWGDLLEPGKAGWLAFSLGVVFLGLLAGWVSRMAGLWFWLGVIGSRWLMLFMEPGDDIYRYIWEGWIQNAGWNPYLLAPDSPQLALLRDSLIHPQINHPSIPAIYPPLAQFCFRALGLFPDPIVAFKLAFTAADLAVCWLVQREAGFKAALLYAWSPVVIYSFAGGGHYDSLMVLPIVVGCLLWSPRSGVRSALCFGLAVSIKWVALPLLGWVLWQHMRRAEWKPFLRCACAGFAAIAVPWILFTMLTGPVRPLRTEFASYARSAEFLPRWWEMLFPQWMETNTLPLIVVGAVSLVLLLTVRRLISFGWWYFVVLLIGSPLIHLWYFTWLLPFGALLRHPSALVLSVSSLVYLALPYRNALRPVSWRLSEFETLALWLPFLLTLVIVEIHRWRQRAASRHACPHPTGSGESPR